jgi:hypothetical protein
MQAFTRDRCKRPAHLAVTVAVHLGIEPWSIEHRASSIEHRASSIEHREDDLTGVGRGRERALQHGNEFRERRVQSGSVVSLR